MTEEQLRRNYFNKPWHSGKYYIKRIEERGFLPSSWREWDMYALGDYAQTFTGYMLSKKNSEACVKALTAAFGHVPTFADFSKSGIETLVRYLSDNFSSSTVGLYLQMTKTALNYFQYDVELEYKRYKQVMHVKVKRSEHIYLNEDEINRFASQVPQNKREVYAQKIFMICASTGMRFSDAIRMDDSFIHDGYLRYASVKTKISASIPAGERLIHFLHVDAEEVSKSEFWYAIKDLCKRAGIDEEITIFERDQNVTKRKYEFVSAHTARRSFCTNLYLRGMDLYDISRLAGHSNVEMTKKYICDSRDVKDEFMDFFK